MKRQKQKKEGIMCTIGRTAGGTACKVHHTGNRDNIRYGTEKEKNDNGAEQCRIIFCKTRFSQTAPTLFMKDYAGKQVQSNHGGEL